MQKRGRRDGRGTYKKEWSLWRAKRVKKTETVHSRAAAKVVRGKKTASSDEENEKRTRGGGENANDGGTEGGGQRGGTPCGTTVDTKKEG